MNIRLPSRLDRLRAWFKTAYFVRGFLMVLISWTVIILLVCHFLIVPEHRGDPGAVELTIGLLKAAVVFSVPLGLLIGYGMRGQDRAIAFQARVRARFNPDPTVNHWWIDRYGTLRLYLNPATAMRPSHYPTEFEGVPIELVLDRPSRD